MDLAEVTMPKAEALEHFKEYRSAVRKRHNAEDVAIMQGYKQLARGLAILSLSRAMKLGGLRNGLPRLAICRADVPRCWLLARTNGSCEFTTNRSSRMSRRTIRDRVSLPEGTFPGIKPADVWSDNQSYDAKSAIVPSVPPRLRPRGSLGLYHVLWEAEWTNEPPRDPALLRYLRGDLWAVLATWDLTEIERLVIAERARG